MFRLEASLELELGLAGARAHDASAQLWHGWRRKISIVDGAAEPATRAIRHCYPTTLVGHPSS